MYAAARLAGRTGAEDGNCWGSRWKPEQKTATTASAIERAFSSARAPTQNKEFTCRANSGCVAAASWLCVL